MDNSPAYENFNNKMTSMRGGVGGSPILKRRKISANKVFNREGSDPLAKQIEKNSREIVLLKNVVILNTNRVSQILVKDAEREKSIQREAQRKQILQDEKDKSKKKEGLLEGVGKSVSKTLLKPVQAVGKTVKGVLGRLADAFMALFAGFIANKGIKMIQALMSGDTETFKKMRNTIIKSVAVVGGIFLALNGGLLALPGIISGVVSAVISIGGAILGFLASPAGLIALGLAAGVGVLFAMKKGIDAASTKGAGGAKFKQKFDDLKGPLTEAGITVKGTGKDEKFYVGKSNSRGRGQKTVEQAGTPEQKEIVANYIIERDRVIGIRDNMRSDMESAEKKLRDESGGGRAGSKSLKDSGAIGDAKKEIRDKYEAQINGMTTSPKINSNPNKKVNVSTLNEAPPNIVDATTNMGGGSVGTSGSGSMASSIPNISASNSDNNFTLYSQTQYNILT